MTSMDLTPNLLPFGLENPKNFGVKDPGSASFYGVYWVEAPSYDDSQRGPHVHCQSETMITFYNFEGFFDVFCNLKLMDTKWYKGHILWRGLVFFLRHFFRLISKTGLWFQTRIRYCFNMFNLQIYWAQGSQSIDYTICLGWVWQKHKTWMVTGSVSLQLFGINEKTHEGPWRPVTNYIKGWCSMKQGPTIKFTCSGCR